MKKKYFYKVVTKRLKSTNVDLPTSNIPKEYIVQYEVGKLVRAKVKDTPLYIFERLRDARSFSRNNIDKWIIFECRAIRPVKVRFMLYPSFLENTKSKEKKRLFGYIKRNATPGRLNECLRSINASINYMDYDVFKCEGLTLLKAVI